MYLCSVVTGSVGVAPRPLLSAQRGEEAPRGESYVHTPGGEGVLFDLGKAKFLHFAADRKG